jgi:hypothetical protein
VLVVWRRQRLAGHVNPPIAAAAMVSGWLALASDELLMYVVAVVFVLMALESASIVRRVGDQLVVWRPLHRVRRLAVPRTVVGYERLGRVIWIRLDDGRNTIDIADLHDVPSVEDAIARLQGALFDRH